MGPTVRKYPSTFKSTVVLQCSVHKWCNPQTKWQGFFQQILMLEVTHDLRNADPPEKAEFGMAREYSQGIHGPHG